MEEDGLTVSRWRSFKKERSILELGAKNNLGLINSGKFFLLLRDPLTNTNLFRLTTFVDKVDLPGKLI